MSCISIHLIYNNIIRSFLFPSYYNKPISTTMKYTIIAIVVAIAFIALSYIALITENNDPTIISINLLLVLCISEIYFSYQEYRHKEIYRMILSMDDAKYQEKNDALITELSNSRLYSFLIPKEQLDFMLKRKIFIPTYAEKIFLVKYWFLNLGIYTIITCMLLFIIASTLLWLHNTQFLSIHHF